MATDMLHVEYPVPQDEQKIPTNGSFPFETSFDLQRAGNKSQVEAEHLQRNMGGYGYPNLGNIDNEVNQSTQNGWRYLEVSAFENVQRTTAIDPLDLAFLFWYGASGNDMNYSYPSPRFPWFLPCVFWK